MKTQTFASTDVRSGAIKRPAYRIEYAAEAEEHLQALGARDVVTVLCRDSWPMGPWCGRGIASLSKPIPLRPGS